MSECDCGAVSDGKWADIHSPRCAVFSLNTLVARLRDNRGHGHAGGCQGCFSTVMDEAADEIERLGKIVDSYHARFPTT